MNKIGIFSDEEKIISSEFLKLYSEEYNLLKKLLEYNKNLIVQLNQCIEDTDTPNHSIELMLGYNITLFNSALINLANGYLGISQIILRSTLENTCLSMYFFEFPKDEIKYRNNRKSFNCKLESLGYDTWVEGWLQRIDKEGRRFIRIEGEENTWYNRIFINLIKEASYFVHTNIDYIYSIVLMKSDGKQQYYSLGPNTYDDLLTKNALWKIVEACLYSCAVLDRVFNQYLPIIDIDFFTDTIKRLNTWKDYYNSNSTDNQLG